LLIAWRINKAWLLLIMSKVRRSNLNIIILCCDQILLRSTELSLILAHHSFSAIVLLLLLIILGLRYNFLSPTHLIELSKLFWLRNLLFILLLGMLTLTLIRWCYRFDKTCKYIKLSNLIFFLLYWCIISERICLSFLFKRFRDFTFSHRVIYFNCSKIK
jgi:hypothetical protein